MLPVSCYNILGIKYQQKKSGKTEDSKIHHSELNMCCVIHLWVAWSFHQDVLNFVAYAMAWYKTIVEYEDLRLDNYTTLFLFRIKSCEMHWKFSLKLKWTCLNWQLSSLVALWQSGRRVRRSCRIRRQAARPRSHRPNAIIVFKITLQSIH